MDLLMALPNMGIVVLLILAVMIFFQVILHNNHETKRYKKLIEKLNELEKKLENK